MDGVDTRRLACTLGHPAERDDGSATGDKIKKRTEVGNT
jgi:hypothetical protein